MDKQREEFDVWYGKKPKNWIEAVKYNKSWQAWQQAQKVAVPDGFVVVPIEPTWEMINAGENACYGDDEEICKIVYKAMVEAGEKK